MLFILNLVSCDFGAAAGASNNSFNNNSMSSNIIFNNSLINAEKEIIPIDVLNLFTLKGGNIYALKEFLDKEGDPESFISYIRRGGDPVQFNNFMLQTYGDPRLFNFTINSGQTIRDLEQSVADKTKETINSLSDLAAQSFEQFLDQR